MLPHYRAISGLIASRSTKPPASPVRAYQGDPARPLAALTLVLTEPKPQERSGGLPGRLAPPVPTQQTDFFKANQRP